MDAWGIGLFDMLVQTTERDMRTYLSTKQGGTTSKRRAKIFNTEMLRGDMSGVVEVFERHGKGRCFDARRYQREIR
jgi:hypothetical protein